MKDRIISANIINGVGLEFLEIAIIQQACVDYEICKRLLKQGYAPTDRIVKSKSVTIAQMLGELKLFSNHFIWDYTTITWDYICHLIDKEIENE